MSGIGALAGYGSDSDDEEQVQAGPSIAPAAAPAPAPAAKAPAKGGLFAALPPPSADKKRKHQIKLDSLADLRSQDDDDEGGRRKKQAKSSDAPSPSAPSSASAHSLFGMLPAPTRKGPPTPPPREAPGEARLTIVETDDGGKADKSGSGATPKKGNADFRAMLGLKPVEKKATAAAAGEGDGLAVPGTIAKVASSGSQPPSSSASSSNGKSSGAQQQAVPSLATTSTAPPKPPKPAPQPVDFFGLAQPTPPAAPVASSSRIPNLSSSSITPISSAPSLSTNHDPYPGWAQNPDGSWIPVTPEAHEAFALAQRQQQTAAAEAEAQAGGLDERQRQQLVAAGYSDLDKLQSVDAAQAAALKRGGKPFDVGAGGADAQSAASRLDAKYAAAAAASKERAEGEDAYDEDDEGASSSRGGGAAGGRDKLTNHRARGKGQLSSLFAQADEKRGDLEEKWARARENKRGAASRYGW